MLFIFFFNFSGVTTHEDDEYRWAGVEDPKIVVTTSRDPSSKLKQFAKVQEGNKYDRFVVVFFLIKLLPLVVYTGNNWPEENIRDHSY